MGSNPRHWHEVRCLTYSVIQMGDGQLVHDLERALSLTFREVR
ncbi:MAG TPA: hypothetical protein VG246_13025 [Acidimicrobiales bacterium]|nr:hypothetical protein [Acidimicrobiales bacterium]